MINPNRTDEQQKTWLESVKAATQQAIASNNTLTSADIPKAYRAGVNDDKQPANSQTADITQAVKLARENNIPLTEIATTIRLSLEALLGQFPTDNTNKLQPQSGWGATEIDKKKGGQGWADSAFRTK